MSGYNLDALLPENGFDVARAPVGSEGTLATVLRAELELLPVPATRGLVVLGYPDVVAADAPCRHCSSTARTASRASTRCCVATRTSSG